MTTLRIMSCDPLTSLQDLGRPGLSRLGIPRSGAMDPLALRVANALVGNAANEAAIELTLGSIRVVAEGGPVRLAVTGAPADIDVAGTRMSHHASLVLDDGETLTVRRPRTGVHTMLAVAGGFDVPTELASRSLYARAAIGGLGGRALGAGDHLPLRLAAAPYRALELACEPVPLCGDAPVRIILGPHADLFTDTAIAALLAAPYRISHASDRMAYRLDGPSLAAPRLEPDQPRELASQGVLSGAIQIPPDGMPLVLMADCQTVAGYPRIATIVTRDLRRVAQSRPGEVVRFAAIGIDEAMSLARIAAAESLRVLPLRHRGRVTGAATATALAHVADAAVNALDMASWDAR